MTAYVIGIDIGTTATKVLLFAPAEGIVAQASRASALNSPHSGFAEADPNEWLTNVFESIREVIAVSDVDPADISAVAASGMVPAVLLVDGSGAAVRPAILQNDTRATRETEEIRYATSSLDLVSSTGSEVTQQSVAPTLLWLSRHEPEAWSRASYVQGSYDWILGRLGAAPHVEQNWAIESGLFALDGSRMQAVVDAAGFDPLLIPSRAAPGTVVGSVNDRTAAATGLHHSTLLVVGGADHVLSAFAAGVEKPGDWLVKLGGAGDILVASQTPITDPRLYLDAHPRPGTWLPNGCMATSGSLIRWFQTLIGGTDLLRLDAEAATRTPADLLCLPYFLGEKSPLHDPNLRGSFTGLHLGHTRADMYRSILESIAFGFRHHVDIFREIGVTMAAARVTNGGSRSTLWKQIHADVLGAELFPVIDHPGASLGAALVAAVALGEIESWDATSAYTSFGDPVHPDPERTRIYDDAYETWRELGTALTPISHSLTERNPS